MKHTAYNHKGTYPGVIPSVVSFISAPWPFLLSVPFTTKTEHMDWVLEQSRKDETRVSQLVHWQETGTVIYKPLETEEADRKRERKRERRRQRGDRAEEGCATSVYLRPYIFFGVTFQTILSAGDKIQKERVAVWINMTRRRAGLTGLYHCAPRERLHSSTVWKMELYLLTYCCSASSPVLPPAWETENIITVYW